MVSHAYNSSTWGVEAGGTKIQSHLQLHTEFTACVT